MYKIQQSIYFVIVFLIVLEALNIYKKRDDKNGNISKAAFKRNN